MIPPPSIATNLNRPASISTQSLLQAWWYGLYNIYYTDRANQSDLSSIQLTFASGSPDGNIVSVGGNGTDGIGTYSINNGTYNKSTKAISFTKQYNNVNNNVAWLYQGIYNNDLFYGSWGTPANANQGNFLIRRTELLEKQSDEGSWRGYYFDAQNNSSLMLIHLNVWKEPNGDETITGSGNDVVGAFTIDGRISTNNSVFAADVANDE
ncbi:3670_t:CDS:2 [Paraglomus occultum]|uniref:3670_t:CDS:1 n=1 Tax=Paraglomus occultum TaxID=144539 RepID=A0A9N8ZKY1_9GLOM|nr:3670_t:CDS:2 [Paraglomus occultum]